jgi:hypothetical protein
MDIALKSDIENAMRMWSETIHVLCDQQYGKGQVGHVLLLFPNKAGGSLSWISTVDKPSVIAALKGLLAHLQPSGIILPN